MAVILIVALTGDMRPDTLLRAEAARFVACLQPSPQEVLPSNR